MKKLKNWLAKRLPLAALAAFASLTFVSCKNSPPETTVVHVHYAQPAPVPAYTQSNEWNNGRPVRRIRNVQDEYIGYARRDDGVSEWRGQWTDDYRRQVAYGTQYRQAGGQYYCQQPPPRPVYRQQYRQPVQYCRPAPRPYCPPSQACGTNYGYRSQLPAPQAYYYYKDPNPNRFRYPTTNVGNGYVRVR